MIAPLSEEMADLLGHLSNLDVSGQASANLLIAESYDSNKALLSYTSIENNASACLSCSGEPCSNSCDYNLNIKKLNTLSHKLLS